MKYFCCTLILLTAFVVLIAGCNPQNKNNKCGVCPAIAVAIPHINFRVVDKTSSQDLFFGSAAPYKISQLKFHHLVNGSPDSVVLWVDSVNHFFSIFVNNQHPVDTVTMQVASKPQDILLFKTARTGGCCSFTILGSVTYNGTIVYTHENGPEVVVFAK